MDITTYILAKKYADQAIEQAKLGSDANLDKYFSEENLQALTEEEILEICKTRKEN